MPYLILFLGWTIIGTVIWVKIQPNWEGQVAPQFCIWCWPIILFAAWLQR